MPQNKSNKDTPEGAGLAAENSSQPHSAADDNDAADSSAAIFGLRTKLLISFLVVSLVPLAALYYQYVNISEKALTEAAYRSLFAAASQTAARLDSFVNNNLDVIESEAQIPALAEFITAPPEIHSSPAAMQDIHELLDSLSRKDSVYISSIALLDLQGNVVADTSEEALGQNLASRNYFRQAIETGLPYASRVLFSSENGKAYIYFSCPVDDRKGHPVGVLRTRYSATLLQELAVFDNDLAGPGSFPMVVDENGVLLAYGHISHLAAREIIFHALQSPGDKLQTLQEKRMLPPGDEEEVMLELPQLAAGMRMAGNAAPFFTTLLPTHGHSVIAGAVASMRLLPFHVAFVQPQDVFLAPIQEQTDATLWLALVIALLAATAGFAMASFLARPIIRLTATVRKVAEGDLSARAEASGSNEVNALARAFNQMTRRLQTILLNLESMVERRTKDLALKAEELEKANARLLELDELKSSFLSSVSHELRTPLTSVMGFAKMVAKDFAKHFKPVSTDNENLGARAERILSNLQIIESEGMRLSRMVNDVLDLNKIESGYLYWNNQVIDPVTLIRRTGSLLEGFFSAVPGLEFKIDVPASLPHIEIDPDRLEQVLINLLNNAAKFTAEGSVVLSAGATPEGALRISVADTGEGIPPSELEDIFDKFHQVRQQDTLKRVSQPGTGLGLAICKQIVAHYHGQITAESSPGSGTTITIELPLFEGQG